MSIKPSKAEELTPAENIQHVKYKKFLGYLFGVTQLKESESSFEYSGVMHVAQCVHMYTL